MDGKVLLSQAIARNLQDMIRSSELKPAEKIPSQRVLIASELCRLCSDTLDLDPATNLNPSVAGLLVGPELRHPSCQSLPVIRAVRVVCSVVNRA